MSESTEKIKVKQDFKLTENKNLAHDKIEIENADIDQLIEIIKNYGDSEKPMTISKKAEIVKSLFYKKINILNKDLELKKTDSRELEFKKYLTFLETKKSF